MMFSKKGFTLVELLISASIIAILAGVTIAVLKPSHFYGKARDGKRKADLEQIRSALEMYRTDAGSYPDSLSFGGSLVYDGNTYMNPVPNDPLFPDQNFYYSGGGNIYQLCAALEIGGSDSCSGSCGVTCDYKLQNP